MLYTKTGFDTLEQALHFYDMSAIFFYKENARTNYPTSNYLDIPDNFIENFGYKKTSKYKNIYKYSKLYWAYDIKINRIRFQNHSFLTEDAAFLALQELIHNHESKDHSMV